MSIDKRGERTWRFRVKHKRQLYTMTYEAPPNLNGKALEKEVERQHMIFKADVVAGRVNLTKDVTMNQLADNVYKEYVLVKTRAGTQKIYANAYNKYILPEFGVMNIQDIKPIHIQKFANKLSKKLSPNSIGNILSCLSRTLSFAEKWEMIEISPYRNIEYERSTNNSNHELLSLEQIEKLVDYYKNEETNLMHKSAFYLAIGCGLRNSEIRALTIDDIDFKNSIININKQIAQIRNEKGEIEEAPAPTKTPGSVRKIYAPQFVLDCLKEYINTLPYIPITRQIFWSHITRKPISKHCLSKRFTALLKELELPAIRFHDLRHLQATILIQSGANIKAVSKRLGHSKTDITLNTYTNTIDAVDKKIAEQFNETFKNLKSLS